MAALSRLVRLALLASLVPIALGAFGAAAASADLVTYPARLHVAGGLTITTKHDFTGSCQPGQAWTIAASADVEINGKIEVEANGKRIVQSTEAKSPGGAVNKSVLSEYHETNYCPPEDPVELARPPQCSSHTGAGVAGLQPDGRNKAPWLVSIGIGRIGGGDQDNSFTLTGSKAVADIDLSPAALIDLCLAENERRMAGYDRRLLRPQVMPRLLRLARRFLRSPVPAPA